MRKISKTRASRLEGLGDERPLRIAGATITSWPGTATVDIDRLLAQPVPGGTVAGAGSGGDGVTSRGGVVRPGKRSRNAGTVALSDGTRITFATAAQFGSVDSD